MNNKNNNVVRATLRTATQVIAILAVILVTLIACGKKDDKESVSNKDLIGTWVYESATIDGKNSIDIVFDTVKISKRLLGDCYKKNKIIFTDKEIVIYYNPQNEMYQKLKRKVHFLAGVERGKGNKKHG